MPKRPLHQHSHSHRSIIGWISGIILTILALLVVTLWSSFQQTIQNKQQNIELYSRMIEGSFSRSLESMEVSLLSLADELQYAEGRAADAGHLNLRIKQILRFAPHLRQIVIMRENRVIADSRGKFSSELDLSRMGLNRSQLNPFTPGLQLGQTVRSRYLPLKGEYLSENNSRELIPFALRFRSRTTGQAYTLVVAYNPDYLKSYIHDLKLDPQDNVYLVNSNAGLIYQKGLYGPYMKPVSALLTQTLNEGRDQISITVQEQNSPASFIHLRLLEKYPLAVVITTRYSEYFTGWISENLSLFIGLVAATLLLITGGIFIILGYRRNLAMREQVHLLSEVVQQATVPMMITDQQFRITYINNAFSRLFGYVLSDIEQRTPSILTAAYTSPDILNRMRGNLVSASPWRGELQAEDINGHTIPVSTSVFPVEHLQSGQIHYIAMLNDIRERKEREEHINLLSRVVEQNPTIIIITDAMGCIEYVNNTFEEVTGYMLEEVLGRNPRFLKSGDTAPQEYQQMWQTITAGGIWNGELHNKRKDGSLYWERASIGSLKNDQGEITHYIATKEIITQIKEDEKQLRLASAVFKTAAEAIMVTDTLNRIQMVNESFTQITGYTQQEVLGRSPDMLRSEHHSDDFYDQLYTQLFHQGYWEGEVWNTRKSGEDYPQWLTVSTMRDTNGSIEGYVALFNDITKRKQDEEIILHQANYDTVTGLPNRNLFSDRLQHALQVTNRSQNSGALLFIDLDRFKQVNDTLGHSVGDRLLQEVAERLQACVRKSDTAARLGGDEFAVIIPEVQDNYVFKNIAGKILKSLSARYVIDGHDIFISCSIGITLYPDDGNEAEQLIRNADSAMYKAKELGRNNYQYYTDKMNNEVLQKRELEIAMHKALQNNEFSLHYQPVWNIESRRIESMEALLRWQHPTRGMISPAEFIPIAEEAGLILQLGDWVIRQSCQFGAKLQQQFSDPPKICINVSSRQIQRGNLSDNVAQALNQTRMKGSGMVLELTESILLADEENTHQQLSQLRDLGLQIAIDDFGTGYSSLSYLKRYPISRLKIDREFIADLETDTDDQALVAGIISMGDALGLEVIAEGVEDKAQLRLLRGMGCRHIQGFIFSPAVTASRAISMLRSRDQDLTKASE